MVGRAWRDALSAPRRIARCESRVRHADGTWRWMEHVFTNLVDDPAVGGVVVNLSDLSERRRADLELEHRSLHDGLTGLAGRGLCSTGSGRRSPGAGGTGPPPVWSCSTSSGWPR